MAFSVLLTGSVNAQPSTASNSEITTNHTSFANSWDFSGFLRVGGVSLSTPPGRLLAISGQSKKQLTGYSETLLKFGLPTQNFYFDGQFYLRTAEMRPFSWNDTTEVTIPKLNLTYLGDGFDVVIGRTHIPAGLAKFANVVDFFSNNSYATAFSLGQFDNGLRIGQVAFGATFIRPTGILISGYIIPQLADLSFENKPLLSSNSDETYVWLRISKDFGRGLYLETLSRIHERDWRLGLSASIGIGDKIILYGDALYRNFRSLPEINAGLTGARFNVEDPSTSFVSGFTYALSTRTSISFEVFYQPAGYSQAKLDRFFDLLQTPSSPIFSSVINTLSRDQLFGKFYFHAEADLPLFEDRIRLVPSITVAADNSRQISARLLYSTEVEGLLLDTRLTGNLGSSRTEFGAMTQDTRLTVAATYKW